MSRAGSSFLTGIDVRVSQQPEPIPIDLRTSWRIATLVLILAGSRARRAGRDKVLLLTYALRNSHLQDDFLAVLSGARSPFFLTVRVDPAVARASAFAAGFGLLTHKHGWTAKLTDQGVAFANAVESDEKLLAAEKSFLSKVRRLATARRVREVLVWR